MDDQDDSADEGPKLSDALDPAVEDMNTEVEPSATEANPDQASAGAAESGTRGTRSASSAYKLRPQGLRPVRRQLRRHGLRNDCPPDRRRPPRSASSRTRLR